MEKNVLRSNDIRQRNEKLVLRLIQRYESLSQSQIVELTGLKAPTVLRIFSYLEQQQLIRKSAAPPISSEKKGRKPVFYRLNPTAGFIIGVEFWSEFITVVICNFIREVVYSESTALDKDREGMSVITQIITLVRESMKKCRIKTDQVLGVGIGAPGQVDIEKGYIQYYSRIRNLNKINIKETLTEGLHLPVMIHNNASVIAMNEYQQMHNKKEKNVFAILIRGGVGGAYINNGTIVTAHQITGLEIGHISVDPKGHQCNCGGRGCLETYVSEHSIIEDIKQKGIVDISMETIQGYLHDARTAESKIVQKILIQKSTTLAFAVRNIITLLLPDIFLIITRNLALSSYFAQKVSEILDHHPPYSGNRNSTILPIMYNNLHAGLGACDIVFQNFFQDQGIMEQDMPLSTRKATPDIDINQ